MILKILMNADIDEAVAFLSPSSAAFVEDIQTDRVETRTEDYWKWRLRMAEKIAMEIDPDKFGVKSMYVFGSTKNATAGPGSDVDLMFHFIGDPKQKEDLLNWLDGWSKCLAEMNYLRTGYKSDGLLDVHIITDDDIRAKNSYAVKINAVTDPAKELPMRRALPL
jgi:predicted nucleotidyltransferase